MLQLDNLPAELREKGLFCCWRYEHRGDKPTKVPYNPRTGGKAQSTNPATFAPLAVALEALESSKSTGAPYSGIGVGLFGDLGAIDIDHCIDGNGAFTALAADVMKTMLGYTEKSPSGTGVRILFKASGFQYDKARFYINNQAAGLEVYIAGCTNKFVTVTGDMIAACEYAERSPQLQQVLDRYMVRPERRPTPPPTPTGPVDLDDVALIERAKRGKGGSAFAALWDGDIWLPLPLGGGYRPLQRPGVVDQPGTRSGGQALSAIGAHAGEVGPATVREHLRGDHHRECRRHLFWRLRSPGTF